MKSAPPDFIIRLGDYLSESIRLPIKSTRFPDYLPDPPIRPHDYFITSGDAFGKMTALRRLLVDLVAEVLEREQSTTMNHYGGCLRDAIAGVDRLLADLRVAARGLPWMETIEQQEDGSIICRPKQPKSMEQNRNPHRKW